MSFPVGNIVKRLPQLRGLSSEHHNALALARRARNAAAGDGGTARAAWADILNRFETELEPHFRSEEESLLPPLDRAGETALVARTVAEHAELRDLVATPAQDPRRAIDRFASLMEQHVRFEERTLFEVAQRQLKPAELERLGHGAGRPIDPSRTP
jgi:hemerythrin-like domain-containing protein